MEALKIVLISILVLFLIIGLWYILILSSLRRQEVRIKEAIAGIDVALTKRFDVLLNILEVSNDYARFETESFLSIISARKSSVSKMMHHTKQEFVEKLDRLHNGINVIVEQYPELRVDRVFKSLQNTILEIETELEAARKLYNQQVLLFNQNINNFPNSIIAKLSHINQKPFFQAEKDNLQDENFKIKEDFI